MQIEFEREMYSLVAFGNPVQVNCTFSVDEVDSNLSWSNRITFYRPKHNECYMSIV